MRKLLQILLTIAVLAVKTARPGGIRSIVAENIALRQQLIVLSRKHRKSPPMTMFDRFVFGLSLFSIPVKRLSKIAIIVQPATVLKFHKVLVKGNIVSYLEALRRNADGEASEKKLSMLY